MKKILILLFPLLLAACSGSDKQSGLKFTVEGTLDNAANKMLYVEEMTPDNGPQFIDSIPCDDKGHFHFKMHADYQTFFNLHTSLYDYIVLLPADGETITVSGNAAALSTNYRVEGSEGSQLMWQIMNYVNDANMAISDIIAIDKHNRETLDDKAYALAHDETDSMFVGERQTVYLMFYNFIQDNAGSLATLYAIDAPFNHSMRVFYAEPDFEVFEMVLEGLEEKCPDNPHTLYYRTRIERARSERQLRQAENQSI